MNSLESRLTKLELQARADWNEAEAWTACWIVANVNHELTLNEWLTDDEQARMLADMPRNLQDKADRAWPIVRAGGA